MSDPLSDALALAGALRGQQDAGSALVAAPIKALNRVGQQWNQDAAQQAGVVMQGMRQQAADRAAALKNALAAEAARATAEYRRARLRQGGQPSFSTVQGPDNQYFRVDNHDPNAPAVPLVGTDGQPITKAPPVRPIPGGDKTAIETRVQNMRALKLLKDKFESRFAGKGWSGGMRTALNQALGSTGSKAMQEDAEFWSEFERMVNLPLRHTMFGATLTAGESQAWKAAQLAKPGADPAVVMRALEAMFAAEHDMVRGRAKALQADNFRPDAIDAISGGYLTDELFGGSGEAPAQRKPGGGGPRGKTRRPGDEFLEE